MKSNAKKEHLSLQSVKVTAVPYHILFETKPECYGLSNCHSTHSSVAVCSISPQSVKSVLLAM